MSSSTPCSVPASPGTAKPPTSAATACAAVGLRSLTTTLAPSAASLRAIARPIPPPPPVTTTPAPLTFVMSERYRVARRTPMGRQKATPVNES